MVFSSSKFGHTGITTTSMSSTVPYKSQYLGPHLLSTEPHGPQVRGDSTTSLATSVSSALVFTARSRVTACSRYKNCGPLSHLSDNKARDPSSAGLSTPEIHVGCTDLVVIHHEFFVLDSPRTNTLKRCPSFWLEQRTM